MEKQRSRSWCFTINNYTQNDVDLLNQVQCQYIVYGYEIGEAGTPHLQGFIYFADAKTLTTIKKKIHNTAHFEITKGTPLQASVYCKKDGRFEERGELPQTQGKRTDLDTIKDVVLQTGKMRDVVLQATSYQSIKMAEQILKYHENKRQWKPIVKWYYGPTGTGKTYSASLELKDYYTTLSTGKWWDGYDAHEDVLIDDMRKDFMKFHELLRLLDRYAFQVETKGGTRQILARRIIITSCYHPSEMFETREDVKQLIRRIDEIKEFK